jgi:hypothetical protein
MNQNARATYSANGPADNIFHNNSFSVTDAGQQIAVSSTNIQNSEATRFTVINRGTDPVRIGFDIDGSNITYADAPGNSWNLHLAPNGDSIDFDRYGGDKTFTKIAFRCNSGESTTVNIIIE